MKTLATILLFVAFMAFSAPVDVNTATAKQLEAVKGIGPSLAGKIIEYRKANGLFETVDDLVKVSGIGPATLEKMKADLTATKPKSVPAAGNRIDVNTADAKTLETLEGIGDVTAKRIVTHREKHGPFKSVDDLLKVERFRKSTLDRIRNKITVDGVAAVTTVEPKGSDEKLRLWKPKR